MLKKIFIGLILCFAGLSMVFAGDITCEFNDGIYHIVIPEETNIEFVSSEHLKTNRQVFEETKARLVVNAGFFDPKNEKTISFIYNNILSRLYKKHNNYIAIMSFLSILYIFQH